MARVEQVCIRGDAGRSPAAELAVRTGDEVQFVEVQAGISSTGYLPGSRGEDIAASDILLDTLMPGVALRAGTAILQLRARVREGSAAVFDVAGAGEVSPGDEISFPREGAASVAVLVLSDSCSAGEREDLSGPALIEALGAAGLAVVRYAVQPDDRPGLASTLRSWCDDSSCDLILTCGGTGFSPRDWTPEATADVVHRMVPGIPELIRASSARTVPGAWLSRAVAGIRGRTLIVNLPGSRTGALESFGHMSHLLGHAMEVLRGEVRVCGG